MNEKIQEPIAWRCFDGEGGYTYTDNDATADAWRFHNGEMYAHWLEPLYATPQPFPAPAVQSCDLDIAVNVFKGLFFNAGLEDESSDEQLRRAMRAALISSGQAIAQTAPAVSGEAIRDAVKTVHARIDSLCEAANTPNADYFDASTNMMIATRDLLVALGDPHSMDFCRAAPSQGAKQ